LVVSQTVDRLREINPSLIYILDPVMGDEGRIYVSEAVIPVYKLLMKKATCATPNYFEAELLTEVKIIDLDSLRLSLKIFHERYSIPNIIISAVSLPATALKKLGLTGANERMLVCVGSSIISSSGEPLETTSFAIAFPELAEHYEGVGDAFSSLVLARFPSLHPLPSDPIHPVSPLAGTAELAIASLQGIIAHTRVHALKLAGGRPELLVGKPGEGAEERVRRLRMVELRLIQSQKEILDPVVTYHAVKL
jgi:pyridoxine kinase